MRTPLPPQRWRELEGLLDQVFELPEADRSGFLERACSGDPELRAELEGLLAADALPRGLLETPGALLAGTLAEGAARELQDAEGRFMEGRHVGPFRLLREIGHGGMGTVYLAERADGLYEQRVAIKLLRHGLDSQAGRARFLRERRVLARLEHAHIARLLDGGVSEDGRPYFAMEYVEGQPIDAWAEAQGLELEPRLRLFLDVCRAVQYAHRNLVVHRDLKPHNILVTPAGEVKLLDFGIAKLLDEEEGAELTRGSARVMTPEYAAPEQVRGEPVTTATDVYGLGLVLFELLTGARAQPLPEHSPADLERVVILRGPERLSLAAQRGARAHWKRRLEGDLETIVLSALRKEPERRYASAEALLGDLQRYLDGQPVVARRPTASYRLRKFVGRHRAAVFATGLVLAALSAGLLGTLWQAREAARQARQAEEIKRFVVSLFETSRPERSKGESVTARELLAQGLKRVDAELRGQPELQAEMLALLGDIHGSLGLYDEAQPLLERALAARQRLHGAASLEVATSLTALGELRVHKGDYAEAERTLRTALVILERRRPEGAELALALDWLGSALNEQGDHDGARRALERALALQRRLYGHEHLQIAWSLNSLGHAHLYKGETRQAEASYREALAMRRKLLSDDDPRVLDDVASLATALFQQGDYVGAEALYREALGSQRRALGDEHPETLSTLIDLAVVLNARGDAAGAERLYRDALAGERKLGPDPPLLGAALKGLARSLSALGRLAEAQPLLQEALASERRRFGPEHMYVAQSLNELGMLARLRGRPADAEALQREALGLFRKLLGDEHSYTGRAWLGLGDALLDEAAVDGAEAAYRQSLAVFRKQLPAGHDLIATASLGLGRALVAQRGYEQAEPLLRESLAIRESALGPEDARTASSRAALGLCLLSRGLRPEAERLLRAALPALSRGAPALQREARAVRTALARLPAPSQAESMSPRGAEVRSPK